MPHDVGSVILSILLVLTAAKIGGEIAERLGQAAVLGELAFGVLVGPAVLGIINETSELAALAELGAILLLFEVGLETDITEVIKVGRAAIRVAFAGVVLPLVMGGAVSIMLGYTSIQAIFLGATLTATSVGITARVLSDMRKLDTREGRTVLGAAVVDDVVGLVILAVVSSLISDNGISVLGLSKIIISAVGFIVVSLFVGSKIAPPLFRWLSSGLRVRGILITASFVFCLLLSYTAQVLHLAPIVGAFAAGVLLARTDQHQEIRERLTPLADIFIPIFFLSMGIKVSLAALGNPSILALAAILLVVGVIGKVAAGWAAPSDFHRLAIGVGLIPRGEVGFIFASFGLAKGIIKADVYSALLLVVALTTFITPPLLKPLFAKISPPRGRTQGKLLLPRRGLSGVSLGPRW